MQTYTAFQSLKMEGENIERVQNWVQGQQICVCRGDGELKDLL